MSEITKRIFVVGCPRSGTTLIQSMLGAHPDIFAFPETQFFRSLHSKRWILRLLGMGSLESYLRIRELLTFVNRCELMPSVFVMRTPETLSEAFVGILDRVARENGRTMWSEKSPGHVHHIEYITDHVANVRFVHVIRNGMDTIASLRHAALNYPEAHWARTYPDLRACFEEWKHAINATAQYCGRPNHVLVRYEAVLDNAETVAKAMCNKLDISFSEAMLANRAEVASAVTHEFEQWKNAVSQPVAPQPSKAASVLSDEEREQVARWIADVAVPDCDS